MKENYGDKVLDGVVKRVEQVTNRLTSDFKGMKPFDKEQIPNEDLMYAYDHLGMEDMDYLIQQHGRDAVNQIISEMETKRRKK